MKSFSLAIYYYYYHHLFITSCRGFTTHNNINLRAIHLSYASKEDREEKEDDADWYPVEMVDIEDDYETFDNEEWIPDREKARKKRELARNYFEHIKKSSKEEDEAIATIEKHKIKDDDDDNKDEKDIKDKEFKKSAYSDEEEELINAMGGKRDSPGKRLPGYLGDSTLDEIATDYSVPICYLADVLCTWGVPVPILTGDRLGDLVTGEQAFAILEAINSLDISVLQDRYSNQNLLLACDDNGIDLKDAFQMAIKEGWSLPFGVRSCLRVEQEEELVRVLGVAQYAEGDDDDENEYDE